MKNLTHKKLVIGLWACCGLFFLRVTGQLLSYWFDIPLLPSFNSWYSGAITYENLFLMQIIIIFFMALFSWRISVNKIIINRKTGTLLQIVGALYFTFMFIRLIISLIGVSDAIWFNFPIPSFFHLVLATYILLVARYHLNNSKV